MNRRVLLVDDDPQLLAGIERRFADSFEIHTALSGGEGLDTMREKGPFATIVTDMRMPGMDGLQFLKAAREIAPDSMYIMLTGNQDIQTATNAVNDGHVYRFLTKPCQGATLKLSIEEGIERFNYLENQRELMHETFIGSVRMLREVLELSHPTIFARVHAVESIAAHFVRELQFEDRWEYKMAIQLSRVGAAVLHAPSNSSFSRESLILNPMEQRKRESELGQALIANIPRLKLVSAMVGRAADADGSLPESVNTDEEVIRAGASLIRVSWMVDEMMTVGMISAEVAREISRDLPRIAPQLLTTIRNLDNLANLAVRGFDFVEIRISNMTDGMILAENLVNDNGILLLSKGARLSGVMIARIRRIFGEHSRRTVRILQPPKLMLI